ncbi:glycoside hydrolase family protein [Cohnella sp. REN36]|uniref:glycoside hydrolase family protein n=1 Tax=Cohnella sp. REN36 TaxID=2887347 RepID=UPI001D142D58|nr:glycoside hydrolase family protein [Cohnella sp. REN36]MCC3374552.1 glycoside hydrolase family protein [Cohnella sp. REN36]
MTTRSLRERFLPAPRNGGFRMDGYWVWCGSVVRGEDGRYHLFASRWSMHLPMHPGWLVHSEVVRAVSDIPEGPYRYEETVLQARGAEYWDGRSTHNPHIVRHENTYLLYYMGTTYPFPDVRPGESYGLDDPRCIVARANKRVGLAVSDSVFGPWRRSDRPIVDVRPRLFDSYLTSNPAPCLHEDGSVLLIYKARQYRGYRYSEMSLGAARADHYRGPYLKISEEPLFPPSEIHLEDPFVWKTSAGYEMIAKDMEGRFGEKHGGVHALSPDGLNWQVAERPQAYSRTVVWEDGAVERMGHFERPFLLFEDGRPTHLFAATADGEDFGCKNTWNMVIPLSE